MATKAKTKFEKKEIESGKVMSVLAYLGILCLIPFLLKKNNKFVRAHAKAGLNLFILEIIWGVLVSFLVAIFAPSALYGIFTGAGLAWGGIALVNAVSWLGNLAFFILSIVGIVNVLNGEYKDLPVLGGFKFIK